MKTRLLFLLIAVMGLLQNMTAYVESGAVKAPANTWASSYTWTVVSTHIFGGTEQDWGNTENDMTLVTDESSSDVDHYVLVKEDIKLEVDVDYWFGIAANHTYTVTFWDHFSINENGIYTVKFHARFVGEGDTELWVETVKTGDYTPEHTWSVSASSAVLGETDNDMTLLEEESSADVKHYVLVKEGAKLEPPINYWYRIVADHSGMLAYPSGGRAKFNVDEYGIYTVTFHACFSSEQTEPTIWVETVKTGFYYPDEKTWTIVGSDILLGSFWDLTDTTNDMEKNSEGIFQLDKRNITLNGNYGYEYKVVANHSWNDENYGKDGVSDGENAVLVVPEDGTYDVRFTFNPFTKELKDYYVLSSDVSEEEGVFTSTTAEGVEMRFRKISESEVEVYGSIDPITKEYVPAIDKWYYNYENTITVPEEIDGYHITRIGDYAFAECFYIQEIIIPNSIKSIGRKALYAGSNLTSYNIPASVVSIADDALNSKATSIVVAEGNPVYDSREGCNAVIETSSNKLLAGCKNTIIPNGVVAIGDYSFQGCGDLKNLAMPESVTTIGNSAFMNCSALTAIDIPNVVSIGNSAFQECSALTAIDIPNVVSIGEKAFWSCKRLTSVEIPNTTTSIGSWSFDNCI